MNARPFVTVGTAVWLALAAAPTFAATKDEAAVLAPVQAMFDGMAKFDQDAMRATVQPEGSVALLRKGKLVRMTLGEFISHIKPGKDAIEERIHDPLVRIDGDLAMVWTPYEFLVNGQVKHCGTDLVHLVRTEGRWVIAGIADNSRDECPK
ncbi:nuclear transport factor 2 family protein [Luteibacter sp. NPDC031894]|jgi:hypothetical protein|uniref:nuclear transport factor 2 family protein n=1 Tax=Luteibacter sp. NPDC031894 TaxID=3390572 RepID=UPI003D066FD1